MENLKGLLKRLDFHISCLHCPERVKLFKSIKLVSKYFKLYHNINPQIALQKVTKLYVNWCFDSLKVRSCTTHVFSNFLKNQVSGKCSVMQCNAYYAVKAQKVFLNILDFQLRYVAPLLTKIFIT